MKINKRIFAGMAVLALLFGLVFAGCATGKYTYSNEETETSQAIYRAATELVASNINGIAAGTLISSLSKEFPGIKLAPILAIQVGSIQFSYDGKSFVMDCTMGDGKAVGGTGGAASTVGPNTPVTAIKSVKEVVRTENQ